MLDNVHHARFLLRKEIKQGFRLSFSRFMYTFILQAEILSNKSCVNLHLTSYFHCTSYYFAIHALTRMYYSDTYIKVYLLIDYSFPSHEVCYSIELSGLYKFAKYLHALSVSRKSSIWMKKKTDPDFPYFLLTRSSSSRSSTKKDQCDRDSSHFPAFSCL